MGAFVEITNGLATQWIGAMWPIIWQSAVLAGVVYLLALCLRRLSAAVRFWLWMLVPLRLLVMPLITVSLPLLPAPTQLETANIEPVSAEMVIAEPPVIRAIETAPVAEEFEPMSAAMEKEYIVSTRIWPNVWALLMGAWLVGIAFWCVRLIRGWRRIRHIAGSATEVSESQVLALAQKAATMLGLRRVPRILVTGESVSPFLFGVLRPVLVIPAGFVAEVRGEALFAVFAHEFAHLRRRDPLVGWVLAICEVIYFFHPVFYFVKRRILFERERACDDWVVATSKARRSIYANALISAADICRGFSTKIGPVGAVTESFGDLKKRLIAIHSNLRPKARLSISALILLVIIGAICVPGIVLTARSTTKAEDKTAEAAKNVASGQAIDPVISESGELRPTIEGETRILHFPRDRSIGKLFVKDMTIKRRIDTFHHWIDNANWEYFGQAMGDVRVPADKQLWLVIYSGFLNAWKDLSPLSKLKPDDLYRLSIHGPYTGGLRPGNRCMPHLAGLTGLRVLDLTNTNISSEGIKFIKGIKSLERLTLPDQITDDGLADVAELQSLKGLYFKKNRITNAGLRHLAKLSSLEELELGGERIGDAGLAHVAKLPSLRYLLLWGNFSDAGLAHLKNVTSLRILHINIRQFSDVGLAHLSDLAELENLSLHYMENITDQSIIHLKKMRSLKKLDIASSQITDRGLEYLAQIKTLEHLDLPQRDQRITDRGLAHLGQLPNLKHLAVSEMHYAFPNMNKEWYTDKGLAELAKCQLLEDLSIGSIGITDAGIEHIAKLTNLKKLHLFGCVNVTDAGLAKLTSLKSLKDLDISRANTTIAGVNQLDSLTNLNRLSVIGLKWDGAVLDISGLTNLENVSLWFSSEAGDAFTDADLVCLADLKRLKWLQIGPRHFTDRGIAYLAGLSNMERLGIGGPGMTDQGLKYLTNMKKLDTLTISNGAFDRNKNAFGSGGSITDKGLSYLEGLKAMRFLEIYSDNSFSTAALQRLRKGLPNLFTLRISGSNGPPLMGRNAPTTTQLERSAQSLAADQIGESMEITGQVQDYQARMVEGADIAIFELHRDDYYSPTSAKLLNKLKKTDHEGRFVFNVIATPYHDIYVIARKEGLALGWGYLHKMRIFQAKPDNNFVDIVLPKPYTLAGRLVDSGGKLVAGANVQVFTRENGGDIVCEPKDWFSVKTDSKGRFVFDNLPLDLTVKFFIEVPNRDIAYIYPPREMEGNACGGYHVDWEDIELTLPPATTVQGQVIDKGTGQGVKDMRLLIFTNKSSQTEWRFRSCERYTLTNGEFEIKGVPPGKHILRFISPKTGPGDWVGKNVPITVNRLDKNVRTKVLIEKGVPLEVIVRDQTTGKALPDMKIQVDDRWNDQQKDIFIHETRAGANGIAHLIVPQGRYKAHAWGGNYETRMNYKGTEVNITGSRTTPVEIFVKPRLPLVRGTVVDTQGQPAENVYITVGLGQRVLTDNNGWFEGMQSPLYPSHMVVARDIKNNLAGANFFFNALRELRVVLRPGSSIRGRVTTDDMGRGIAGANVNIQLNCKRRGGGRDVHGTAHLHTAGTRTDSEGYYRLETVMPLRSSFHYHLSFDATEFGPTRYTLTDRMKPGEEVTIPDMKLVTLDAFISGVVLDENDNPVARKPVFVGSDSGGAHIGRATSTDEQGRFKFNRIPEGPVTLQSGFGQGSDAAYIFAHSGDNVTIKLGNHFKNYMSPFSLVGSQLPNLRVLEMGFDYKGIKNKKTLVVFVDYTNRPSQIAIDLLKRRQLELRRSKVEVVCIQVAPVDEGDLVAWKKENKISFPIYILPGQSGWNGKNNLLILKQTPKIMNTLRQEWGVRSLPWTILTDENQKILATGLNIPGILHMVYEEERRSPLRNNPIGRRRR